MALLSARLNIGRLNAERLHYIGADTTAPTAPINLAASALTAYSIGLTWQAATDYYGVTQYRIERCRGAGCSTFVDIGTAPGLAYTDPTVDPLTLYRYRIRAQDATGNLGAYSNIATATTPDRTPRTNVSLWINGAWVSVTLYARVAAATVTQALNEVADTIRITFSGSIPYPLKGTQIMLADEVGAWYFLGHLTAVRTIYEGRARNVAYECDGLDYTWILNARKVTARYTATYLSLILKDLMQRVAPAGFTLDVSAITGNVALDLVLDEITFTNEDLAQAISRTCERAGLYWYVDYGKAVHVFPSSAVPSAGTIDDAHPRTAVKLAKHDDAAAVATRVLARGGGSAASIDIPAGSTTLPIDDPVWYLSGGYVECGPQHLWYTGVFNPGTGALVGSGNAPTVPPTVAAATGSNLTVGAVYQYAVSFVTAAGETLAGATAAYAPVGATIAPAPAPEVKNTGSPAYGQNLMVNGGSYRWAWEKYIAGGGKVPGTPSAPITVNNTTLWQVRIPNELYDANVTGLTLYRTANGGSTFYADYRTIMGVPGSGAGWVTTGTSPDGDLVQFPQMSGGGASVLAAALSQIPTRAGATARKIYRTAANGSQLKLLATINDNSTTTFLDTVTDAALGVNAPITDTSGFQSGGQVNAGSPAILVSNVSPFPANGGWVRVSGMTLRYTTVSGSSLVLAAPLPSTLSYGSEILNAAYLIGIPPNGDGSIVYPIKGGDEVFLWTYRQDLAAINALAAATGGDGIREEFLTDGRLAFAELNARADALLAMRKASLVTVTFETRDPAVVVGKTITFNTTLPPIAGTFLIQRVTISQFQAKGSIGHPDPLRVVEASSRRYTFEDLVQQIKLLGRIN